MRKIFRVTMRDENESKMVYIRTVTVQFLQKTTLVNPSNISYKNNLPKWYTRSEHKNGNLKWNLNNNPIVSLNLPSLRCRLSINPYCHSATSCTKFHL